MHIDPINGEGIEAVKKFERAGGSTIFLVNKTTKDWGIEAKGVADFVDIYDKTIALGEDISSSTSVNVFPVIGIHPAEFVHMCSTFGIEKAQQIGEGAIDAAGKIIEEGRAVALGEVGRPHFPVESPILKASNDLMAYAMRTAAEVGCPVQLHTESLEKGAFEEFASMAIKEGLEPKKVIKHYSPPFIEEGQKTGVLPSLVASKGNIRKALEEGTRFLMESDYIDSLQRPGAVVGPKSVPRVSKALLEAEILSEDDLYTIHVDNVEKVYGVDVS
jgi:TatD-related deoxyribonuclease